jgi:hypothetical protein
MFKAQLCATTHKALASNLSKETGAAGPAEGMRRAEALGRTFSKAMSLYA